MAAPILDDPARTLGDLLRVGVVAAVDLAAARATVRLDDETLTPPLPWAAARAGAVRVWLPPSVGEQVTVLAPEGEISAGIIAGGIYCNAHPAPDNTAAAVITFEDGTRLSYAPASRELTAQLAPGGTVRIATEGDIILTGNVIIDGDVEVTGKVTATEDVTAAGKSLKTHKHTAVAAGGAVSGPPQ